MREVTPYKEVSTGHVTVSKSGRTSWPTSLVPPPMYRWEIETVTLASGLQ